MARVGNLILGLIAGAAIGAGAAMLFAPAEGRETRRKIKGQVDRVRSKTTQVSEKIMQQLAVRGGRVDINKASREELMAIEGIGPATADAIIRYRAEHGRFKNLEELKDIVGSTEATIDQLRGQVQI